MSDKTTIQITRDTAVKLDEAGDVMRRIFADLYATSSPTKDTVIHFLLGNFFADLTDEDIDQLRKDWAARALGMKDLA